jgi:hypothetical protein
MKIDNNRIILEGILQEYKKRNLLNLDDSAVFEFFVSDLISKSKKILFEDLENAIVDGGNDGGIDSIFIFHNDELITSQEVIKDLKFNDNCKIQLILLQSKKEKGFAETSLDKILTNTKILFDLSKNEGYLNKRFNADLVEKILIFSELVKKSFSHGGSIEIVYYYCTMATNKKVTFSFEEKRKEIIEATQKYISNSKVEFNLIDSEDLISMFKKPITMDLSFEFRDFFPSSSYKTSGRGLIGLVKISDYYNAILDENKKIREELFVDNVRHYQGKRGFNKDISETLLDDFQRDFWWLNNGITIIGSTIKESGKKVLIKEPRIVNGLQTTYTIGTYYNVDEKKEDRCLLVKIIENNEFETVDKIISSTNSQNPISKTILRATDPFQRKIEEFFLHNGYYYDRRKNYYKNFKKPADKIISMQYTGQAVEAILFKNPYTARNNKIALFSDNKNYNRIFSDKIPLQVYLNCALILKKTLNYFKKEKLPEKNIFVLNFKIHVARIVASVLTKKANYDESDIINFSETEFNSKVFQKSVDILIQAIKRYKKVQKNVESNIIYIAKSKNFMTFLNKFLTSSQKALK